MKKGIKIALISCVPVLAGAVIACACVGAGTRVEQKPVIWYLDETTEVTTNDELTTSLISEELTTTEEKTLNDKIDDFKETFLVPILSGVSLTSVLSVVLTLVLNAIRNKKLDKKTILCEEKLAEATAILSTIKGVYANVTEDKEINEETKQVINTQMQKLVALLEENTELVSKVQKIEPILRLLCQLQIKLAKASSDVISSGAVQDIEEISKLIKEF